MTRTAKRRSRPILLAAPLAAALFAPSAARADERLTADEAARRAQATSHDLRARGEELAAAQAGVDQATAAFIPRLGGTARYTRLSHLTPPALGTFVAAPGATPGATPDPGSLVAVPFVFPIIQNQYLAQATLQVPLSDYLLRLPQARAAATDGARSAAANETATRLRVGLDARVVYWSWVRALQQARVAAQAVEQANAHLADARKAATAGTASQADVLRVEAQVASAELLLTRATNLGVIAEQQLRTLMHDEPGKRYEVGETIDVAGGADGGDDVGPRDAADAPVPSLWAEAAEQRPELRALADAASSARQQAKVARAAGLPRLDAIGNAVYANPNPRVFPQEAKYTGTWDATLQLAWAPTDLFAAQAARRASLARAAELDERRAAALDAVKLEVSQSAQLVAEARAAARTARRGLSAAEESARVRRLLYQNGRATSVELTDAETELTRARLEVVGAEIDLRIARARLAHALGRDGARG